MTAETGRYDLPLILRPSYGCTKYHIIPHLLEQALESGMSIPPRSVSVSLISAEHVTMIAAAASLQLQLCGMLGRGSPTLPSGLARNN